MISRLRMRWARTAVGDAFGGSQPVPTRAPRPGQHTGPVTYLAA